MKLKLFFKYFIIIILATQSLFCQSDEWTKYSNARLQAMELLNSNEYSKATDLYRGLYSLYDKLHFETDYYNYIYCLTKSDDTIEIKKILFEIVQLNWFDLSYLKDTIFYNLKSKEFWPLLDSLAIENGEKNYFFADTLSKIVAIDQKIRTEHSLLYENKSLSGIERDSLSKLLKKQMNYIDSANTSILKNLIELYGFPTWKLVGNKASFNAWLIAQHANIEFQEWYLIHLEQAVKDNNILFTLYGYLVDRIRIKKKIPQLYGTQGYSNGDHHPIEDIDNLNFRRESVLLPPVNINTISVLKSFPY